MISKILNFFKNNGLIVPLSLDEMAIQRLNLERKRKNQNLYLEIEIRRDRIGKGSVYVGFSPESDTKKIHPIFGQIISQENYDTLNYGVISYEESMGKYLFYPNIDLEWFDTPKRNIKQIKSNKLFTKPDSSWNSDQICEIPPIMEILSLPGVISCYAKENVFQIEFESSEIQREAEERISELLLIYFSDLYPIFVSD